MKISTPLGILLFVLLILTACQYEGAINTNKTSGAHLISCEQTLNIIQNNTPNYKIIDIRKPKQYLKNHIPNAIHTWRPEYANKSHTTKGMMAEKAQMQALLQKWGVTESDTLILYDGRGNSNACRMWWILKQYGFEQVKILDGSYIRWQQLNFPTDTIHTQTAKSQIKLKDLNPKKSANISEVEQHFKQGKILLDSRTIGEYKGETIKGNVKRGGHIPNAVRFDWSELVKIGKGEDGTFRDIETIKAKLDKIEVSKEDDIIVYCQSGVRSACVTFVLSELLGYTNVRNYDGSWLEWSDTDLEIEQE